ncbi:hypothetical protein LY76DRAFT_200231 [Colletotrichum caudatum]|nr:hypothetical protein LY76DRAFT_200231 [Colletotrichum caudatum]
MRMKDRELLFFAASNNTNNGPEKYPASMNDYVISVRGADINGSPIPEFNPAPSRGASVHPRVCTLAQDVPCDWERNTLSGCAVATPILAAASALFLQFSWGFTASEIETAVADYDPWLTEALVERPAMESLFRLIGTEEQNNLWHVKPRDLFKNLRDEDSVYFQRIHDACKQVSGRIGVCPEGSQNIVESLAERICIVS